ncbi:MAG: helix-turn-helix transcriptional regulator [Alphaproteobacteria bacterium]|nr:AraC family transcriptional regulator [Alphaproteobacteria bacterium]MDE2074840.1 helix-turn-helix transcriptional regulator [Alphaproteobacteria bacterium]
MDIWRKVHRLIKAKPIIGGRVEGAIPLYAERYLLQGVDRVVPGLETLGLITQFGGARVHEGEVGHWRAVTLPSQSLLVPRGCATHWHYSGTVDFALFYFIDESLAAVQRLISLTEGAEAPLLFSDPLVGATALEIMNELNKGSGGDKAFIDALVEVMLKQTWRVLSEQKSGKLSPRNVHLARLQTLLPYIREHLAADLRAETLAEMAGVSIAHLRRLFQDAAGVPLHRFVLNARIEQARKLLATTSFPIYRIAQECGFSSQSHLTASFKASHVATPAEYRASIQRSQRRAAAKEAGANEPGEA